MASVSTRNQIAVGCEKRHVSYQDRTRYTRQVSPGAHLLSLGALGQVTVEEDEEGLHLGFKSLGAESNESAVDLDSCPHTVSRSSDAR